jgi:hypothetical protein
MHATMPLGAVEEEPELRELVSAQIGRQVEVAVLREQTCEGGVP